MLLHDSTHFMYSRHSIRSVSWELVCLCELCRLLAFVGLAWPACLPACLSTGSSNMSIAFGLNCAAASLLRAPPFYGFFAIFLHKIFDLLEKNVRKLFPSRTFSAAFTARHCPYNCPGKSGGYWKFESACCAQKDFGVGTMRMGTKLKIFIHLFCFVFGLGF